ncbi:DUF4350 domain-containing protein [Demequina flava]|uniref:DUF4350 domain-containing protein n=1 Tax=Demequina flava TaxID=1095025 RepID=UPI0009E6085A|nr:DUF4350 domain-containing protein [Demequina flava]
MTATSTASPTGSSPEYTSAQVRPGAAAQVRQHPLITAAVVLLIIAVTLLVWGNEPEDTTALSPYNAGPEGARAAAQILGDQGVNVRYVSTLAATSTAAADSTTLVIASPDFLGRDQVEAILDYPGDIVFLGSSRAVSQVAGLGTDSGGDYVEPTAIAAGCSDPDAQAAQEVTVSVGAIADAGGSGVETCFTTPDGYSAYVTANDGDRTVRVIASTDIVTNAHLAEQGHAALTLRALGHQPSIVWYVGNLYDLSLPTWAGDGEAPEDFEVSPDALPPWFGPLVFMAFLTVLVAGLWQGRRFGRLVPEPLPVIVPAAEAVRGRARLYRRAGDVPHACAALRAQTATRIGRRLGVPRSGNADALIDAIHRATGRRREDVARLLAGPLPQKSTDMMTMIKELDSLESEVHRP